MFRVTEEGGAPWHTGPEVQIQDNVKGHDPQLAGWLYQLYSPNPVPFVGNIPDATRPAGEWNQIYLKISAQGCEIMMNGVGYSRFQIGSKDWNERVAKSKFAKMEGFGKAAKGHICLQDHGDLVSYRNIKIRRLPADGKVADPVTGALPVTVEKAFPALEWANWKSETDEGKNIPFRPIVLTHPAMARTASSSPASTAWFTNSPMIRPPRPRRCTRYPGPLLLHRQAERRRVPGDGRPSEVQGERQAIRLLHPQAEAAAVGGVRVHDRGRWSCEGTRADGDPAAVLEPQRRHALLRQGRDAVYRSGRRRSGQRPARERSEHGNLAGQDPADRCRSPRHGQGLRRAKDNPFVGKDGVLPEIYSSGWRNPWRIAVDSKTGDLWGADVGQNLYEEINIITKGGNYGWNRLEATHPFGNKAATGETVAPVWEYDHMTGKSITGGTVYRGSAVPALAGKYVYATTSAARSGP